MCTLFWLLTFFASAALTFLLYFDILNLAKYLRTEKPQSNGNQTQPADDKLFGFFKKIAFRLSACIIAYWICFGLLPTIFYLNFPASAENNGVPMGASTLGDSFGFANTLFSGLAFGGVILAIIIQTIELRYQRDEIRNSNTEYNRQSTALQHSAFLSAASSLLQGYLAEYQSTGSIDAIDKHAALLGTLEELIRLPSINNIDTSVTRLLSEKSALIAKSNRVKIMSFNFINKATETRSLFSTIDSSNINNLIQHLTALNHIAEEIGKEEKSDTYNKYLLVRDNQSISELESNHIKILSSLFYRGREFNRKLTSMINACREEEDYINGRIAPQPTRLPEFNATHISIEPAAPRPEFKAKYSEFLSDLNLDLTFFSRVFT